MAKKARPFVLKPGAIIQYAGEIWRVVRYDADHEKVEGIEVHVVPMKSKR